MNQDEEGQLCVQILNAFAMLPDDDAVTKHTDLAVLTRTALVTKTAGCVIATCTPSERCVT